ncbi:MAG TPA: hypothetical protein VFI90_13035 [Rubrobacter sp.]|nr:hypothetical protein [Rubrobacter sp.]
MRAVRSDSTRAGPRFWTRLAFVVPLVGILRWAAHPSIARWRAGSFTSALR